MDARLRCFPPARPADRYPNASASISDETSRAIVEDALWNRSKGPPLPGNDAALECTPLDKDTAHLAVEATLRLV